MTPEDYSGLNMAGPFTIDASQVVALGARFTPFVNVLLESECASLGLEGFALTTTHKENVGDGGVDASIEGASASPAGWIRQGDAALQFKSGDLEPAACRKELREAKWAQEYLKNGATYTLVVGAELTDQKLKRRRRALRDEALELGLVEPHEVDRLEIYDAEKVARWASTHPALALNPLIGGPGDVASDFTRWRDAAGHASEWTPDAERSEFIDTIRSNLRPDGRKDNIRVSGNSGFGKTRLVMEALNDADLRPLVVYVSDESRLDQASLNHLLRGERPAVVILDECEPDRHTKICEFLRSDSPVTIITIGPTGFATSQSPTLRIRELEDQEIETLLEATFTDLWPEALRFVTTNSHGNPRWAIDMAHVIRRSPMDASELITRNEIEKFITNLIPEGRDFFIASSLALLTRVGWDNEVESQLAALAVLAGCSVDEMKRVGELLEQRGFMSQHGRYRSVSPHPFAVYLATQAWHRHGDQIITKLLPLLDSESRIRLFERLSHLGRFGEAAQHLQRFFERSGPFASLQSINDSSVGRELTMLAIVMPEETLQHLGKLVEEASLQDLGTLRECRRDLVWTFEKLVWHTSLFEQAADSLLKLAEAETETYANNSTGTWIGLFAAGLPATAAKPSQRIAYLQDLSRREDLFAKKMCVDACREALSSFENVTVSGELQGGAVVEPRGGTKTYGETANYKTQLLEILDQLGKSNDQTAVLARDAIVDSMHSLLDDPFMADRYIESVATLQTPELRVMRAEALALQERYRRVKDTHPKAKAKLDALLDALPAVDAEESFRALASMDRWDLQEGQLVERMTLAARDLGLESVLAIVDEILSSTPHLSAAWDVGNAVARAFGRDAQAEGALLAVSAHNLEALIGFLHGPDDGGTADAFDSFLLSPVRGKLSDSDCLMLACRAPITEASQLVVLELVQRVSVAEGAYILASWRSDLDEDTIANLIAQTWLPKLTSTADYASLITWTSRVLLEEDRLVDSIGGQLETILERRRAFPGLGQAAWHWARVADRLTSRSGPLVARLIAELIVGDDDYISSRSEEAKVLAACAEDWPQEVMAVLGQALQESTWRIQIPSRGWLLDGVPVEAVAEWIGGDLERARLIATVAPIEGEEKQVSDLARFLLVNFDGDNEIGGSLYGELISGSFTGNLSDRAASQMADIAPWVAEGGAVQDWVEKALGSLRNQVDEARQRESEEEW